MTNITNSQENRSSVQNEIMPPATNLLHLSSTPHIRSSTSVPQIMRNVIVALIPAAMLSVVFFNIGALLIIITSIATSVVSEFLFCLITKKKITLNDYSAIVSGLLLALSLPPLVPLWIVATGAFISTVIFKSLFGGLGQNIFNPALGGRAVLTICFGQLMSSGWVDPAWGTIAGVDTTSSATPLGYLKEQLALGAVTSTYLKDSILHLFIGNVGGSIGETSAAALLIGGTWLWYKRIIGCSITLPFILTFFIISWFFNGSGELFTQEALMIAVFQLCAGGLLLGAIFMANEPSSTPITPRGKIIFGIGCGILTAAFRHSSIMNEGVCFAILTMNIATPLIEMYTKPRAYGRQRKHA